MIIDTYSVHCEILLSYSRLTKCIHSKMLVCVLSERTMCMLSETTLCMLSERTMYMHSKLRPIETTFKLDPTSTFTTATISTSNYPAPQQKLLLSNNCSTPLDLSCPISLSVSKLRFPSHEAIYLMLTNLAATAVGQSLTEKLLGQASHLNLQSLTCYILTLAGLGNIAPRQPKPKVNMKTSQTFANNLR
jgi:hypothetical protein